jgi:MFS family permease
MSSRHRSSGAAIESRAWFILSALVLSRIGFGYQFQTVASLGPELISRFQLDYAAFGSLIGAYMVPGIFVALPLGLLGRRFGDRRVLGVGLSLMTVGPLISAVGGGVIGIAIGRGVAGAGAVAMIVLQSKVLADWFRGRHFMLAVSISVSAYPVGVGLSQMIDPLLSQCFGWPAAFLSGSAEMAIATAIFLAAHRDSDDAAAVPRSFSFPTGRECLALGLAGLIWTAYTAGYTGFLSYAPALMAQRGEPLALTALVVGLATWGSAPATLIGGAVATHFGAQRTFVIGTVSLVVGMAGFGLLDWPVTWSSVLGVPGSLHPGVIIALGTLSARTENRAVGMGVFYTMYYAGGAVVPALCGHAADLYGSPVGAMFAASAISAVALPAYFLHRRVSSYGSNVRAVS